MFRFPSFLIATLVVLWGASLNVYSQEQLGFEVRTVEVSTPNKQHWHSVEFTKRFDSAPVVILGPVTFVGSGPVSTQIRNVTHAGFEFQIREWDYQDGSHSNERVTYFAIEEGEGLLGQLPVVVGRTQHIESLATIALPPGFESPVVLAHVEGGGSTALARIAAVTPESFESHVQVEEAEDVAMALPLGVGWVAIEQGQTEAGGRSLDVGLLATSQLWEAVPEWAGDAHLLASVQTAAEWDTVNIRRTTNEGQRLDIRLHEEASADSETVHAAEQVGFLALSQPLEPRLELGVLDLLVDGNWVYVPLDVDYADPIVVLGQILESEGVPSIAELRNVRSDGFEVRLSTWSHLQPDGGTREVPYILMERGVYDVGGKFWEAGSVEGVAGFWKSASFEAGFEDAPVVLSSRVAGADADPAVLRHRSVSGAGFQLRLSEAEAADGLYAPERANFIAMPAGGVTMADGTILSAGVHGSGTDDQWGWRGFNTWLEEPFYFGTILTTVGGDPGMGRFRGIEPNRIELRFEEEQSADTELWHGAEQFAFLLAGVTSLPMEPGNDADGDGIENSEEILVHGTNPSAADTDGDDIADQAELDLGTDPTVVDSDGDGMPDGWEASWAQHGFDATVAQSGDHGPMGDPDADGWSNILEYERGMNPYISEEVDGFWLRQHWSDLPLYSARLLQRDRRYLSSPSDVIPQDSSSTGQVDENRHGNRIRGYVVPSTGGEYRFWLSAKNSAILYISSDDTKFKKRKVAEIGTELGHGHGISLESGLLWNSYPTQASVPLVLEAGQKYFVEIVYQQGHTKISHASVAWSQHGGERALIPASQLRSFAEDGNDGDDDSLPDDWEQQHGLRLDDNGFFDALREGQEGDFDGDGRSNHREFLDGTDPSVEDPPLPSDAGTIGDGDQLLLSLSGASLPADDGWFRRTDGSLQATGTREVFGITFDASEAGVYKIEWLIGSTGQDEGWGQVSILAKVDGNSEHRSASLPAEGPSPLVVTTRPLEVGQHDASVQLLDLDLFHRFRVYGVQVYRVSDGGAEQIALAGNTMTFDGGEVLLSPLFVEGIERFSGAAKLIADGQELSTLPGPEGMWYQDLELPEDGSPIAVSLGAEGQSPVLAGTATWGITRIVTIAGEPLHRVGSAIRMGVQPIDPSAVITAVDMIVNGPQSWSKERLSGDVMTAARVYRFDQPGRYLLKAKWKENGVLKSAQRHIRFTEASFDPGIREASQGTLRNWVTRYRGGSTIDNYSVQAPSFVYARIEQTNTWRRYQVGSERTGDYPILLRLGGDTGPVAAAGTLACFDASSAFRTGIEMIHLHGNGDRVYRSALSIDNFPEGATAVVSIFVGGVTFMDGTISQTYSAADFPENGVVDLEYYVPNSTKTSICHRVNVYDSEGLKLK